MNDLALQVRRIDDIEVDDVNRPHSRRGEVQQHRTPQPTSSHHQHPRPQQPPLSLPAHLRQDNMPRVAFDLLVGEALSGQGLEPLSVEREKKNFTTETRRPRRKSKSTDYRDEHRLASSNQQWRLYPLAFILTLRALRVSVVNQLPHSPRSMSR